MTAIGHNPKREARNGAVHQKQLSVVSSQLSVKTPRQTTVVSSNVLDSALGDSTTAGRTEGPHVIHMEPTLSHTFAWAGARSCYAGMRSRRLNRGSSLMDFPAFR